MLDLKGKRSRSDSDKTDGLLEQLEELLELKSTLEVDIGCVKEMIFDQLERKHGELQAGEYVLAGSKRMLTVSVSERWTWDNEVLMELVESDQPEYIKVKATVDRRTFQKLSLEEQAKLRPALTIKPMKTSAKLNLEDV